MFDSVVPYPEGLKQLNTFDGFLSEFYSRLQSTDLKAEQVYDSVEDDHEKFFGNRKYSSYESFRVMRARKIKKK